MANWASKQVGPLPMGAWAAVLAGGLGLAYFINRNAPKPRAEPAISTGTPEGVAEGAGPGVLTPLATGPIAVGPVTNEEWAARAIAELEARGHPIELVEPAITHYVQGAKLSASELVYVSLAQAILGNPPLPIPVTPIPQPQPTSPGTPGSTGRPAKPTIKSKQLSREAVLISWTPVVNATSYEVRRIRGGTPGTGEPWQPLGVTLSYTAIARVRTKTKFAWEIRARNSHGASVAARTPTYTLG